MDARAIPDLTAVSGTWHGTIHVDVYGDVPFTLVIKPAGAYDGLIAGVTPLDGRMTVEDGQLRDRSTSGRTAVTVRQEGAGERRLVGRTDAGETYELAPDAT